jgi:hypothetical protein
LLVTVRSMLEHDLLTLPATGGQAVLLQRHIARHVPADRGEQPHALHLRRQVPPAHLAQHAPLRARRQVDSCWAEGQGLNRKRAG